MRRWSFNYLLLACVMVILAANLGACAEGVTYISKDQLRQDLAQPGVVTVIDVRTNRDWDSSPWKIEGAQRQSPAQVKEWMGKYPKNETIVLYCA